MMAVAGEGRGGRSTAVSRRRGRQEAACTRGRGSAARMNSNWCKAVRLLPRLHYVGSCDDHRTAMSRTSWRQRWWGCAGPIDSEHGHLCKREAGEVFAEACGRVADGGESAQHTGARNLVVQPGALSMLTDGTRQEGAWTSTIHTCSR
jgi:hypothetical protein